MKYLSGVRNKEKVWDSDFLKSLDIFLEWLAENPFTFFNVSKTIRRVAITRFPSNAYYSINNIFITIHVIMHQHKNPEEWQMRI